MAADGCPRIGSNAAHGDPLLFAMAASACGGIIWSVVVLSEEGAIPTGWIEVSLNEQPSR